MVTEWPAMQRTDKLSVRMPEITEQLSIGYISVTEQEQPGIQSSFRKTDFPESHLIFK